MSTVVFEPISGDNAPAITELFQKGGPGTTVLLKQKALYRLETQIKLTHDNTTLATEGFPSIDSGDQAILETRGAREAGAIDMFNKSHTTLKNLHIRGCRGWGATKPSSPEEEERLRQEGKLGWVEGGSALVWMGGGLSKGSVVDSCRLEDPRAWTCLHLCDFGEDAKVTNNVVGPSGQQASGGPWADGLSIAGKNCLIEGNYVFDATDGAIVLFCAPGTLVQNNTVVARERDLLGAINMVDDFPFDRNFSNTRVINNTIRSEGAYIRLGIGIGPTCWSPWNPNHKIVYGGVVENNKFGPGTMGYAIAVSGAKDFRVQGNTYDKATEFVGDTHRLTPPYNAPPMPFLRQYAHDNRVIDCDIQSDFVEGGASWLIGVEPGCGDRLVFEPGQITMSHNANSVKLKDSLFKMRHTGQLVLEASDGRVLWASGKKPAKRGFSKPTLQYTRSGHLCICENGNTDKVGWCPTNYLDHCLDKPSAEALKDNRPKVVLQSYEPYITVRSHERCTLFATSYVYHNGQFEMRSNEYVAIAPLPYRGVSAPANVDEEESAPKEEEPQSHKHKVRGLISKFTRELNLNGDTPPPVICDTKPTFFYLSPKGQVYLHSSARPREPEPEHTHWVVPNNGEDGLQDTWIALQHDGNMVLYSRKNDQVNVRWASGTNGDENSQAATLLLKGLDEQDGPAVVLLKRDGSVRWTSK